MSASPTHLGPSVGELRAAAESRLSRAPFAVERRESLLLLAFVLGWSEARVLARGEHSVSACEHAQFLDLLDRRCQGEPAAYLFGEREFFGRPYTVDRRVLIPRPETEHAVEAVLDRDLAAGSRVLDLGCGSGCIAITIAAERPDLKVFACDLSFDALMVTRINRRRHLSATDESADSEGECPDPVSFLEDPKLDLLSQVLAGPQQPSGGEARLGRRPARSRRQRLPLAACDLGSAIDLGAIDLVVSNLPYVDPREASSLSSEIRDFEPARALFAERGIDLIARFLDQARAHLRPGCAVVLEIGAGQQELVLAQAGGFTLERMRRDYSGHDRILELVRTR